MVYMEKEPKEKSVDICICITHLISCTTEMNIVLSINYNINFIKDNTIKKLF